MIVLIGIPMKYGTIDFLGSSLLNEKGHYLLTYRYRLSSYLNRKLGIKLDDKISNMKLFNKKPVLYGYRGEAYFNPFVKQTFQRDQIEEGQDVFLNSMGTYMVWITFKLDDARELNFGKLREIQNGIKISFNTNKNEHRPLWTITYYLIISLLVILFSILYYLANIKRGRDIIKRYIFALKKLNIGFKIAEKYNFINNTDFRDNIIRCYDREDCEVSEKKLKESINNVISSLRCALELQKDENFPVALLIYPSEFIYKKVLDITCLPKVLQQVKQVKNQAENGGNGIIVKFKALMEPASEITNVSKRLNRYFTLIVTGSTIVVGSGIFGFFKSWLILIPLLYSYILLNILCFLYLVLDVNFNKIKNNRGLDFQ